MDKHGMRAECKINYIPVSLCKYPDKKLITMTVYGFGMKPMLLLTNLKIKEKKELCVTLAKIYLMRWRIEEYFNFKKQQFGPKDFRVISLQSIRNLRLIATLATGYIGILSSENNVI